MLFERTQVWIGAKLQDILSYNPGLELVKKNTGLKVVLSSKVFNCILEPSFLLVPSSKVWSCRVKNQVWKRTQVCSWIKEPRIWICGVRIISEFSDTRIPIDVNTSHSSNLPASSARILLVQTPPPSPQPPPCILSHLPLYPLSSGITSLT